MVIRGGVNNTHNSIVLLVFHVNQAVRTHASQRVPDSLARIDSKINRDPQRQVGIKINLTEAPNRITGDLRVVERAKAGVAVRTEAAVRVEADLEAVEVAVAVVTPRNLSLLVRVVITNLRVSGRKLQAVKISRS